MIETIFKTIQEGGVLQEQGGFIEGILNKHLIDIQTLRFAKNKSVKPFRFIPDLSERQPNTIGEFHTHILSEEPSRMDDWTMYIRALFLKSYILGIMKIGTDGITINYYLYNRFKKRYFLKKETINVNKAQKFYDQNLFDVVVELSGQRLLSSEMDQIKDAVQKDKDELGLF